MANPRSLTPTTNRGRHRGSVPFEPLLRPAMRRRSPFQGIVAVVSRLSSIEVLGSKGLETAGERLGRDIAYRVMSTSSDPEPRNHIPRAP